MKNWTTGELAKLCGISVRTVQYYDKEKLLCPVSHSEGNRRLYSEESLKKLQIIILYKQLGLSLDEIKVVMSKEDYKSLLIQILCEKEKMIDFQMRDNIKKKEHIKMVKQTIEKDETIEQEQLLQTEKIVRAKRKLKKIYIAMLVIGIFVELVTAGTIVFWSIKGIWWPFVIAVVVQLAVAASLSKIYYDNAAYICANCKTKFKLSFWKTFFASHTTKTRKLKCPHCGEVHCQLETYFDDDCQISK